MKVFLIISAVALLIGTLLWFYLPVGRIDGHRVMLRDWWENRLTLQFVRAQAELDAVISLPAAERLPALLRLHEKHGDLPLAGDRIREAIVATGQDAALHYVDQLIARGGHCNVPSAAAKAARKGDAQPYFRKKMFEKLVPYLDAPEDVEAGVNRKDVPGALLDLDREWATRVLTSAEYLSPQHPLFSEIVKALTQARISVELPALSLEEPPKDGKEANVRLATARAVALTDRPEGERQLRLLVDSGLGIRMSAAIELAALRGLPHPDDIGGIRYRGGPANLNARERSLLLAYQAYWAMGNSGMTGLVEEGEFKAVPLAEIVTALRETGAPGAARQVEAFITLLGPVADERDPELRVKQLRALGDDFVDQVNVLEEKGVPGGNGEYEDGEFFIYHYLLEHEADFERE